jgi:hypothetical protein
MPTFGYSETRRANDRIRKAMLDLIYNAGLLKNEVVGLSVKDVVQKNGSIVSVIRPVSGSYPKGFEKESVTLSNKPRQILSDHIEYIQKDLKMGSPATPLFPDAGTGLRYDEKKLWHVVGKTGTYEQYRQAGIANYCRELRTTGTSEAKILDKAHELSRYVNLKRTQQLVEKWREEDRRQSDPQYEQTCKLGRKLVSDVENWPDRESAVFPAFKQNLTKLSEEDRRSVIDPLNKELIDAKVIKNIVIDQNGEAQIKDVGRRISYNKKGRSRSGVVIL